MRLRKRDTHYHTYADYLTWSASHGDEVINGTAYVREPPSPSPSHQWMAGELYRQIANVLKGIDRTLTLHRLEGGRYGRRTRLELKGKTPITVVPGVIIDWDQVLAEISAELRTLADTFDD
jgi:hypothetical protein